MINLDEKLMLTLLSPKINVLIIGGGRAAYIKFKTFFQKNCRICIVSKEFCREFDEFRGRPNLNIIKDEYNEKYIIHKHIVVIALNNCHVSYEIKKDCCKLYKICIDCAQPHNGNAIVPCQRSTDNLYFGINTKGVSPRTAVFIADIVKKCMGKYDDFVKFSCQMRNNLPEGHIRREIMKFICSNDFYFFYEKNKAKIVLDMFYGR